MAPIIKPVELPTGVKLPYVEQGDLAGEPVQQQHGFADSWHSFDLVLPHLPESIHAFALTQRGHGDASRPATGYHLHDVAADVAAFLDAVNLEAAVIAGHSMGSSVAQRFAIDYPERVLGLVLVSSRTALRNRPGVQELWDSTISKQRDPIDPNFVRGFTVLAQPVPHAFLETTLHESLKMPARVWLAIFGAGLEVDLSGELGKIEAPTLIIWGEQDRSIRQSDQEALAAAITGSRLTTYTRAGHLLHWEEPARFASDLVTFIQDLGN